MVVGRFQAGLFLASLVVLLFAADPAGALTRQDVDDGNYLRGTLAWLDGKGTISWSSTGSEDPGGAGPDVGRDIYESQPLPRTLYVNASRNIELDLYLAGVASPPNAASPCASNPGLGAELFAGTRLVGGALPGQTQFKDVVFEAAPDGYAVCRMRFASEVNALAGGTVLRLVITHVASDTVRPLYGMGEGHESVLRVPFFSEAEMPYRYPGAVHGAPPPSDVASGLGQWVFGLGATGLAVSSLGKRRGLSASILVALFLTAGLAGCASAPTETRADPAGEVRAPTSLAPNYQEAPESIQGRGTLTGRVVAADLLVPVAGAQVALLGTPEHTTTDPYGRFTFARIEPRTHHLRIDKTDYEAYEAFVPVRPDVISRVNVSLVPLHPGDPSKRPHFHDYWGGKTERLLMDQVDLGVVACNFATGIQCTPATAFRVPPPEGANDFASILPGTYEVNVTLDWDPAAIGWETVGLTLQANHDPVAANVSTFLPRGPGKPFHIATTWEMSDPGHQRFSTWTFTIYGGKRTPSQGAVADQQRSIASSLDAPVYTASVRIRKGVVPLDRVHPDPWQGADVYTTIHEERRDWNQHNIPGGANLKFPGWSRAAWLASRLVPPGTLWLELYVNISRSLPYEVEFRYKTAASGAPSALCWSGSGYNNYACDSPEPGYRILGYLTSPATRWVLPLDATDEDPFYAPRSFWVFGVQPRDDATNVALFHADRRMSGGINNVRPPNWPDFHLTVISHRDPLPEI